MAKMDPALKWIKTELDDALGDDLTEQEYAVDGKTINIKAFIFVDGDDPEETREFLTEVAKEAAPGYEVKLKGMFLSRDIPRAIVFQVRKHAQKPDDVYWIEKLDDKPLTVRVKVRHKELFLGKKRNRLQKLHAAVDDVILTVEPLGSQYDVGLLKTMPALHAWLEPLLMGSKLGSVHIHAYKRDTNSQSLHLVYDHEDVPPESLTELATTIMLKTDVLLTFEQRMSKVRARQHIENALKALKWLEGFHISFLDKTQTFQVTADAEAEHKAELIALSRELERATQTKILVHIDVAKDVLVSRIVSSFPEDGIITGLKHIDASLYDVEAAIPFDGANERLNAWSDHIEETWGAKLMISEPFLRAPDLRFRALRGEDQETISKRYNRPGEFPQDVLDLADDNSKVDIEAEALKRRDIRKTVVLSIDPERTRDIDDALSVTNYSDGIYEVGVHIADVAHFVPKDTVLDQEALKRGFTTYLKEGEIPVLPVVLANGECSLHGNVDRLAVSVFMRMTENAELVDFEVCKTVIHNHARLAYKEAQAMLNGEDGQYAWNVTTLGKLAKQMRARRKFEGALDLSLGNDPEKESHQLIEEFMLQANECVGTFLREKHPEKLCLYRTHPDVTETNFEDLNALAHHLRLGVDIQNQGDMQKALEAAIKTDHFDVFRFHVGRTLEKAVYHVEQLGHGALAKEDYAHFTSPIRRYPDLIVHRLIEDVLYSEERGNVSCYDKEEMRAAISHLNMMEVRVDAASFESHRLADLQDYDGARRAYRGRILSFMNGWVSVKLYDTDLLVKVRYRDYNATALMPTSINDEFSNRWYSLGEEVEVRTDGVDWNSKSIKANLPRG